MDKSLYNKNSIESLSPLEFTRLKPGVYCGDTSYSTQLLVEVVSNSVDEFRLGHGNLIDVTIKGLEITVKDHGQGFLVNEIREDGKTVLEAAFSVLNTSGKYREDGTYEGTSLGSFGIGSKIANFLSHYLVVNSVRDNEQETIVFKEGIFERREVGHSFQENGTTVTWLPSEEFFTSPKVEIEKIKELFSTLVCLCPGLTINLDDNGTKYNYFSKNGLSDLVDSITKGSEIIKNRFQTHLKDGKNSIDFILTYTPNHSMNIVPYVNTGLTEKGPHITQIKSLITKEFNKFFREKKWLKDKDENLSGDDIQEGLLIVFNIVCPNVAYNAQVKTTVTKIDMTSFISGLSKEIQNWLAINEKDIKSIAEKALLARKARDAAKKAREAVRKTKDKKQGFVNLPTKLVDAWSKDREKCELLIAEGDSAASGLIGARNSEFQACFPIRGKIINLYKNTDEKVFSNQEVVNIIKALGLDIDSKTNKMVYNKSKLRYGKIILCCDADADGQAIKNLLLTYFWSLCPELVTNNHIFVAVPPLFRITTNKNKYLYVKDAIELEKYKIEHQNEKFSINRNKG